MPRGMSPEGLKAVFAQQTEFVILPFMKVEGAGATTLYLVRDVVDHMRGGNLYQSLHFDAAPPSEEAGTMKEITIAIDNSTREIRTLIELTTGKPKVTLEYVRGDDTEAAAEAGPFEFFVENAIYNQAIATLTLRYIEVFQLRYPQHSFIPAWFPDLFD